MDFKYLIETGSSDKVIESVILQKILFNKRKKNIEDKLVFFERNIAELSLHEKYYIGSLLLSMIERNRKLLNNENLGNSQKKIINQNILELKELLKKIPKIPVSKPMRQGSWEEIVLRENSGENYLKIPNRGGNKNKIYNKYIMSYRDDKMKNINRVSKSLARPLPGTMSDEQAEEELAEFLNIPVEELNKPDPELAELESSISDEERIVYEQEADPEDPELQNLLDWYENEELKEEERLAKEYNIIESGSNIPSNTNPSFVSRLLRRMKGQVGGVDLNKMSIKELTSFYAKKYNNIEKLKNIYNAFINKINSIDKKSLTEDQKKKLKIQVISLFKMQTKTWSLQSKQALREVDSMKLSEFKPFIKTNEERLKKLKTILINRGVTEEQLDEVVDLDESGFENITINDIPAVKSSRGGARKTYKKNKKSNKRKTLHKKSKRKSRKEKKNKKRKTSKKKTTKRKH